MKSYYLLQNYISVDRSLYAAKPDPYPETELPDDLLSNESKVEIYLKAADNSSVSLETPENKTSYVGRSLLEVEDPDKNTPSKDFSFKKITISSDNNKETEKEEQDKVQITESTVPSKTISINDPGLDPDELIALEGIGKTYARRLIKERRINGDYTDFKDLDKRVPLSKGNKSWDNYPIIFDI